MTEEDYKTAIKRYGFLASLPIIIAIVHLLFTVFFMSTVNYNAETNIYSNLYTLGELFSVSSFSAILLGMQSSLTTMRSMTSIIGVIIGLALIFLSTYAVKGNKRPFYISFFVYAFDTLMLIPSIICSYTLDTSVRYQVYDLIITILLHAIFIAIYFYGFSIIKKINIYEQQATLIENTIHINRG